jgi:hypothetical protein
MEILGWQIAWLTGGKKDTKQPYDEAQTEGAESVRYLFPIGLLGIVFYFLLIMSSSLPASARRANLGGLLDPRRVDPCVPTADWESQAMRSSFFLACKLRVAFDERVK